MPDWGLMLGEANRTLRSSVSRNDMPGVNPFEQFITRAGDIGFIELCDLVSLIVSPFQAIFRPALSRLWGRKVVRLGVYYTRYVKDRGAADFV